MLNRRRFLMISAALAAAPVAAQAEPIYVWRGMAMGSAAQIRLAHPDAQAITSRAVAEIARLEGIFSLYRADSALSQLNAAGVLDAPPFELLECLTLAGSVHHASDGRFDPTVQRLWQMQAEAAVAGQSPDPAALRDALALTGWQGVTLDPYRITLRAGMALTLNGIAQGYVADRVAALLREQGLDNMLIDTGEMRALGGQPDGGDWPVTLAASGQRITLRDRALATSAPFGTVLDAAGKVGHILNPRTGLSAPVAWQGVSVAAPTAALADALSTAACLCSDRAEMARLVARFDGAALIDAIA